MQWNQETYQKMMQMLEKVVPESFRDIALDSLCTDAETSARDRQASEIEEQDLLKALEFSPGFIQQDLYTALSNLGVTITQSS